MTSTESGRFARGQAKAGWGMDAASSGSRGWSKVCWSIVAGALVVTPLSVTWGATPAMAAAGPTVSIGDASVVEGDVHSRNLVFAVTLSEASGSTVTVDYVITGDDAVGGNAKTPNVDFNNKNGATKTLTFKKPLTVKPTPVVTYVSVPVYPDTNDEDDESFSVTLSNATAGYAIGDAVGTGTIIDDDPGSGTRVSVGSASISEGDTTKRNVKFTVSLSQPAPSPMTVDYTIVPVTAMGGYKGGSNPPPGTDLADRLGSVQTIAFKTGNFQKTVAVTVYPDVAAELDETFTLALANPTGGLSIDRAEATGTIVDDDLEPGSLFSWGSNEVTGETVAAPTAAGSSGWMQLSQSGSALHQAGIRSDGTLWTWGLNSSGQLGFDDTVDRWTPTQVGTDSDWAYVTTAAASTFALKNDGSLYASGFNFCGVLGVGSGAETVEHFTQVAGTWTSVAAGDLNAVAIDDVGRLWHWGNIDSYLFDCLSQPALVSVPNELAAYTAPPDVPVEDPFGNFIAPGSGSWQSVAGGDGNWAIAGDGTLWAWGDSGFVDQTMLDNATRPGEPEFDYRRVNRTPFQVGSDGDWTQLEIGPGRAAVRKLSGVWWAWGANDFGQLGVGDQTPRANPTAIADSASFDDIAFGAQHAVGRRSDGTLAVWGDSWFIGLPFGPPDHYSSPTALPSSNLWQAIGVMKQVNWAASA